MSQSPRHLWAFCPQGSHRNVFVTLLLATCSDTEEVFFYENIFTVLRAMHEIIFTQFGGAA